MRRRGVQRWSVCFADAMDLEAFHTGFTTRLERHPVTGGYGRWLNPLGRWDWWDLGGRFDGRIIGERARSAGRSTAQISSGESRGRSVLANLGTLLEDALGQAPAAEVDVRSDRNIELVATLLTDAQARRDHAYPSALILPPGVAEDRLRWLEPGRTPARRRPSPGLACRLTRAGRRWWRQPTPASRTTGPPEWPIISEPDG
jgi:hypothetical protein